LAEPDFEVGVVGGGMVGAALACALAQRGFAVVLLESRAPELDWDTSTHDLRVSAITRASQNLLDNLGAWPAVAAEQVTPYQSMHVWDKAGIGEIHFDAADLGEPDLGHIVENRVVVRALWQRLRETDATLLVPAELRDLARDDSGARITTGDGTLRVGLVVGADGARSRVRELAGIGTRGEPYDQHAVVATLHAEFGNGATAWQRFLRTGPLALLPLERDLVSIVWSTSPAEAERLCAIASTDFEQELTEASEGRLGRLSLRSERAAFPLRLQHARHYVEPGLALIGDAAHVIHPLAGQGVNLGFLDAGSLVDALLAGRAAGRAPGVLRDLRAYERSRRGHNTATQLAMDGFKKVFGNRSRALGLVRNLGLGTAGRIAPLRRQFERVALGYGIELPSLSRPA
jgi:2-octaprenylphenol hydroxylase